MKVIKEKTGGGTMLRVGIIMLLTLLGTGSLRSAEIKPDWQMEWKKTVEAAKKKARLMFTSPAGVQFSMQVNFRSVILR